jgi:uncharacterized membrane protein (UPF0182 family)
MGNRLAYADTYDQALSELIGSLGGTQPAIEAPNAQVPTTPTSPQMPSGTAAPSNDASRKLQEVRDHLHRYQDLSAQGKWAEAGKELEAIRKLIQK